MNLRKKVFLAFFGFIIIPLFVIGSITYLVIQNIIEKNYTDQSELTIQAIGHNISSIFKEANTYSEYWRFQSELNAMLASSDGIGGQSSRYLDNISILKSTFLTYLAVDKVAIYDVQGDYAAAFKRKDRDILKVPFYQFRSHEVYKEMIEQNGRATWVGPNEYTSVIDSDGQFTSIRLMRDPSSMEIKGYLLLTMRFNELDRLASSFFYNQPEASRFLIVNHSGTILKDSKSQLDGHNLKDYSSGSVDLTKEYATSKVMFNGVESMLSVYDFDLEKEGIKNWSLVYITPWDYLSGKTLTVLKWVSIVITFFLICALLFNLLFVNRYIRFISYFVSKMKHAELGDLRVRVPVRGHDETTILARGFNSLVARMELLIEEIKMEQERKKKAELMLLEAQIKPHFLFNTLESINALAIQNEGKKVSQIVYRLGSMLRMFEHKEEISVALEMNYLKNYMDIQAFRFEDLFQYEFDLPKELENYSILKLTLQPLVENSIQHGFEGLEGGGAIKISVEDQGDHIVIWVEDNGKGIPSDVLNRLEYKGTSLKLPKQATETKRIGLGILNVADRLRIHYGNSCGIFICSELSKGTTIKCVIPKYIAG
ncbi:sensor histidine kinase [Paenibacillus sp. N1-5-1-14]|uniref:cache domain-containing sensor histidine kinase n=1 Tax=Paenibacillus radicibacter TaxID=2972488 RepID=UPI002158EBCA|nr:sensor histidine kinase [Paenibacillus radicibacter]MCR8644062.1 sensor histidine kinase [Paenibacillus radicibacter]